MNILHVSSNDLKGGRFAGYYMNEGVDPRCHRVEMAVGWKESESSHVHHLQYRTRSPMWIANELAKRISDRLSLDGLLVPLGSSLPAKHYFRSADLVHLHLLHARPFFSLLSLPRLTRLKPTIWTIHDPWAMTGQCVHPMECEKWLSGCHGRCPHPRGRSPIRRYMAAPLWAIKRWVYSRSDLTLVAASRWVEDRLRRSPLLSHQPIRRIPFGVDLNRFKSTPTSRLEARRRLCLDPEANVIAFRGLPLAADAHKGCAWLLKALELYEPRRPTCLIVIQDALDFRFLRLKYGVLDLGWVDDATLADAYAAADIFVMPSTQEAFGLMAVEAMASGTPVITFEGTAIPEVIQAPRGGLAVPMKDCTALARAIGLLFEDEPLRLTLGRQARELAEQEYSAEMYVDRHLRLYEATIERFAKELPLMVRRPQ